MINFTLTKIDYKFLARIALFSTFCVFLIIKWFNFYIKGIESNSFFLFFFVFFIFFFFYFMVPKSVDHFFNIFGSDFFLNSFLSFRKIIPFNKTYLITFIIFFWFLLEPYYLLLTDSSFSFKLLLFLFSLIRVFVLIFSSFYSLINSKLFDDFQNSSFLITKTDTRRVGKAVDVRLKAAKGGPWEILGASTLVTGGFLASFHAEGGKIKTTSVNKLNVEISETEKSITETTEKVSQSKMRYLTTPKGDDHETKTAIEKAIKEEFIALESLYANLEQHKVMLDETRSRVSSESTMRLGLQSFRRDAGLEPKGTRILTDEINSIIGKKPLLANPTDDFLASSILEKINLFFFILKKQIDFFI